MLGKGVRVSSLLFLSIFFLAGCSAITVGGQFSAGRRALLAGDPETAVSYFSAVAEQNPNYVNVIQNYREGVWTYLGRAQYETKRYQEARRSLERALAMNKDDAMAKLYLGLTLMQTGDVSRGVKETEAGMKGLYDWIEYMNRTRPFQDFWDPTRQIRKQIDQDLAAIASKDFKPELLIADAEWVGKKFEEELDRVREDERREFERDHERDRRGPSVSLNIGF
jgi:tetratricopeptide (TPR) repeat protein